MGGVGQWRIIYQNPETTRGRTGDLELLLQIGGGRSLEQAKAHLLASLGRCIRDKRVLRAMELVPREFFVPADLTHLAYEDTPLPIGDGQTISQPLIVAIMTEALKLQGHEQVLEIGTGSGYHAAILAQVAGRVISIERKEALVESARQRLKALHIENVEVHQALSTLGWPAQAPYEAIVVTAGAPPSIPHSLVDQLQEGGRMIIPAGGRQRQELLRATRRGGRLLIERLGPCGFVPLVGDEAWEDE